MTIELTDKEQIVCKIGSYGLPVPKTVSAIRLEHTCPEKKKSRDLDQTTTGEGKGESGTCREPVENDMQLYYTFLDIDEKMRFKFEENREPPVYPAICFGGGGSRTFDLP